MSDMLFGILGKYYTRGLDELIYDYYCRIRIIRKVDDIGEICEDNAVALINFDKLNDEELSVGLWSFFEIGNTKYIKIIAEKGLNNYNRCLAFACYYGNLEMINLMLEKGISGDYALNWALGSACFGGHIEIANLMIEKGADNFNLGFCRASRAGHIELVKLMIEKGVDEANALNWGLCDSCSYGYTDITNFLIQKGATYCTSCRNTKHPELPQLNQN